MADDPLSTYLPYLSHLPVVLRQGPFIGRFLLAFEAVLSGLPKEADPDGIASGEGIEPILRGIDRIFDPWRTDPEFLPWLSQWVATSLREDWTEQTRRRFIGSIVPLYRKRGTREGIEAVLQLSGDEAEVLDFSDGRDEAREREMFGEGKKPPHFFGVIVTVKERDPMALARRTRRVRAIIDREKPAHTYYGLRILYPALQINNDPEAHPERGPGIRLPRAGEPPLVLGTTRAFSETPQPAAASGGSDG